MVRIKRVYDEPSREDGYRVLVDRLWPRGLKKEEAQADAWMKEVAPSDALRKWFAHDVKKWPEFQRRYLIELRKHTKELEQLRRLEKKHKTMTLLFGAKDEKHNQAVVLAKMLKKR